MNATKSSRLAAIAAGVGGAAVGGFGAAAGRDLWKKSKKDNGGILLIAVLCAAFYLPFRGAKNAMAAHGVHKDPTPLDVLMMAAGPAIVFAAFSFAMLASPDKSFEDIWAVFLIPASGAALGGLSGASQGRENLRLKKTTQANDQFLADNGFVETDETNVSHYDADGNALRMMEKKPDLIVFMAVGRRNQRAYIQLAPDGRMMSYSGLKSTSSNK